MRTRQLNPKLIADSSVLQPYDVQWFVAALTPCEQTPLAYNPTQPIATEALEICEFFYLDQNDVLYVLNKNSDGELRIDQGIRRIDLATGLVEALNVVEPTDVLHYGQVHPMRLSDGVIELGRAGRLMSCHV